MSWKAKRVRDNSGRARAVWLRRRLWAVLVEKAVTKGRRRVIIAKAWGIGRERARI
jgi:hypothetical protein